MSFFYGGYTIAERHETGGVGILSIVSSRHLVLSSWIAGTLETADFGDFLELVGLSKDVAMPTDHDADAYSGH